MNEFNHVDWAEEQREELKEKGFFTREETIEMCLELLKKNNKVKKGTLRAWRHRWKNASLSQRTITKLLELGGFKKAMELYRKGDS